MEQNSIQAFENRLREMGIRPETLGKTGTALPPIPASDPAALQQNKFDNFYKYRAQEFWQNAEVNSHKVEDFKKCQHYLVQKNHEVECKKCHVGWTVPSTMKARDGKLYNNDQLLEFSI